MHEASIDSESLPWKQIPTSLAGMSAFNNVEYGGQTNTTFLLPLKDKRNDG